MEPGKNLILHLAVSVLFILAFYPPLASAKPLGERIVLDNGITLLVTERPGAPMVVVNVLIKAGSVVEPPEKSGLANLTAELLTQGTAKRTAAEIAQETDFMGMSLAASSDYDYVKVEMTALKRYLDKGAGILADILINPTFPREEVSRKVVEIEGELKKNEEDSGWVAEHEFLKTLFKTHPYGRLVEGDEESIKRLTREDIINFHSNYYLPNRTIIAVAGDITPSRARSLVERNFGNWRREEIKEKTLANPSNPEKTVSINLDRKITQANIVLGHLGITRDNPDYYTLKVMNYILGGGGFSSRLMNEIRDKRGLAYSVSSEFVARKYSGYFQVELQTKNRSATDVIELVLDNMKRMRENEVSDKELEGAKAYLIGSLPLQIETNKEVAENIALIEFYGLGLDYFDKFPDYIEAVTKEDVLRVAQKYLHPEKYVLVTVANLEEANIR